MWYIKNVWQYMNSDFAVATPVINDYKNTTTGIPLVTLHKHACIWEKKKDFQHVSFLKIPWYTCNSTNSIIICNHTTVHVPLGLYSSKKNC